MEYDFSAFASGLDGGMTGSDSGMSGMSGSGGAMGGSGGTMGGFGSGMGGGTNSFGSGTGDADLKGLFGESPWGGLSSVGFTSLEEVFRGNAGANLLERGSTPSSSSNTQTGGDSLLTGGEGSTSATSAYSYNFSNFSQ